MAELDSIEIRGFKSIAAAKVELRDVNIVIGANGSGKSNFIRAFDLLSWIGEGRLQKYVGLSGGSDNVLHFGRRATKELSLRISFDCGECVYCIGLEPAETGTLFPGREEIVLRSNDGNAELKIFSLAPWGMEAGVARRDLGGESADLARECLGRWRIHHFQDTGPASPLKSDPNLNDNANLRSDGANLAAYLHLLKKRHPEAYETIRRTVRMAAPFFDDFQLEPMADRPDQIRLKWRHRHSDDYFDVSSLSGGTLRFMALATLFLQPSELRPSLILVDEPELGLHPAAISLLASMIHQAATETRVIVATQSPQLLDNFEPEDVLVADLENGATKFRRLDPERLKDWLEEYSLGQLWEKNELGGRPGSAAGG